MGGNLDQIQPLLVSDAQRLCRRHNAQLFALCPDEPDFLVVDLLIQFMHLLANGRSTSILKSQNADT